MTSKELLKIKSDLKKGTKYSLLKINKCDDDKETINITSTLQVMIGIEKQIMKKQKYTKTVKTGYAVGLIDPIITKHYIITKNFIKESEKSKIIIRNYYIKKYDCDIQFIYDLTLDQKSKPNISTYVIIKFELKNIKKVVEFMKVINL